MTYVLTLNPPTENPQEFIDKHGWHAFARVYFYWKTRLKAISNDLLRESADYAELERRRVVVTLWCDRYHRYMPLYWSWRKAQLSERK